MAGSIRLGVALAIPLLGMAGDASRGSSERLREEEVSFQSDKAALAGTLTLPEDSPGRVPAVVFVHGSGPADRRFFEGLARIFARRGIASLRYDKRGTGGSTGSWLDASFELLARDAVAAVEHARGRKEIDPDRVGLWGISQGGWIAPLAASLSKDVSFVILVSAPAVPGSEQDSQRVLYELIANGFPEAKAREGLAAYVALRDAIRDPKRPPAEAMKELEEGRKAWWGPFAFPPIFRSQDLLQRIQAAFGVPGPEHDPLPTLGKVSCPVLAIYGEKDTLVPVKENRSLLEEALRKGGNINVTVKVFPNANHDICLCGNGSVTEMIQRGGLSEMAPGYPETMSDWILDRTRRKAGEEAPPRR